jgi:hypothetical protein
LNDNHSSNDKDKDDEAHSTSHPRQGALPPAFYRLHPPNHNKPKLQKIPLTKVKAKAATHTEADRQIIHIYLQATIQIKADMPDWPGLMKVYDFLHFQVGTNATILVLPSKRRGRGRQKSYRDTLEYQDKPKYIPHLFPRLPTFSPRPHCLLAAAAKKHASATKQDPDTPTINNKPSTTLKVRVCVSIYRFQLPTLDRAASLLLDPYMKINVDPIRSEMVERIGWLTGTHKHMNQHHWVHFISSQLISIVGCCYEFRLEMEALSPPPGSVRQ